MKKFMFRYLPLLAMVSLMACSEKKADAVEDSAAMDSDEWPLMDEFHMIMAESFHPYKDSANIAPAIAYADEMAAMAAKWSESELPEKVNHESVKADLNALKEATAAFVQTVQGDNAEEIGQALTELHNLFHKLQDAWYSGGHDHGHHH
jgi:hypothetical protein